MRIIIKFILKSIFEKKFRAFIIIFSIALSSALFFASSGMSGTMSSMYENQIRMRTGKADIIMQSDNKSPSRTFKISPESIDGVSLTTGNISTLGIYKLSEKDAAKFKNKTENFTLVGFNINELNLLNPVNFSYKAIGKEFEGNSIVLSSIFADKYGFKVGDRIDIKINGKDRILTVWGISRPTGIFQHSPQSDTITALMPIDTLASLLNIKGRVQTAYVVLEEGANLQYVKDTLENFYPRLKISEPFSAEEINQYMQIIVVPLFLMTMMVLFISVFIV